MKYFFLIVFISLIAVYLLTYILMNQKKRKRYYFFISEVFFLTLGYLAARFGNIASNHNFMNYKQILSIMLISFIIFTISLQYRYKLIKRLSNKLFPISFISIISSAVIMLFIFALVKHNFSINIFMLFVFLSGSSFTFVSFTKSRYIRHIVHAGLFSPIIYTVIYLIFFISTILFGNIQFNNTIFIFIISIPVFSLLMGYLTITLKKTEWILFVFASLLIFIPFSTHYGILPMFIAFLLAIIITNMTEKYPDMYYNMFINTEKPAYFLLLLIAGTYLRFDLIILLLFAILLLFKIIFSTIFFGVLFGNYKKAPSASGISGFEFIGFFSLLLAGLIDQTLFTGAVVFMLLSQIVQSGVMYANDTN